MKNYFHFSLIVSFCVIGGYCTSEKRTSLGIKYNKNIPTTADLSSWKLGIVHKISRIQCISLCMQTDNCFWSTFNSGTCELLSITKTDIDNLTLVNNGGLSTYQMIRGCSKQSCQEIDGCYFLQFSNSCIKYNEVEALDYESAKTICTQHGGELLRIDSQFKQDTLGEILTNCLNVETDLLVQGTKDDAGNWLFDDGTHMPYFNWNSDGGQPSNGIDELYITIKSMRSWKWHDFHTFNGRRFLCEIYA